MSSVLGRGEVETRMLATWNPSLEERRKGCKDQDRKTGRPAMLEFGCKGMFLGIGRCARGVNEGGKAHCQTKVKGWVGESRVPGVGVPSSGGGLQSGVGPLGLVGVQSMSPLEGPSSRSSRGMVESITTMAIGHH